LSKEIGGYFELESYGAPPYHKDAILLNSGRSVLKCIIRLYEITELYVPFYTCPVVWQAAREEGCKLRFYEIGSDFMPVEELPSDAFVVANNYFGLCDDNIYKLAEKYKNLIVDNAQSFYAKPLGAASFYSPRKFFGLPDGGLLICGKEWNRTFDKDMPHKYMSHNKMKHLLKRYDLGAKAGYRDFKKNEDSLANRPIYEMSVLTQALMGNINYEKAKKIRRENYIYLHESLESINKLKLSVCTEGPMVYPLLLKQVDISEKLMIYPLRLKHEAIREKLIEHDIFVAQYWSGTEKVVPEYSFSNILHEFVLPLPIDQRYGAKDMKRVLEILYASI